MIQRMRFFVLFFSLYFLSTPISASESTIGGIVGNELTYVRALRIKLKIDESCPVSSDEIKVSAIRRMSEHGIPFDAGESALYSIRIQALCLELEDGNIVYSGDLELHMPVLLPSYILTGEPENHQFTVMPVWSAKRYGVLGTPPSALQARALFTEVDLMIDELNGMWARFR